MYYYRSNTPIDFWDGFVTIGEYLEILLNRINKNSKVSVWPDLTATKIVAKLMTAAAILYGELGWSGNIRDCENIFVFGLPSCDYSDDTKIAFAIKDDRDGYACFISPYELTWLNNRDDIEVKKID